MSTRRKRPRPLTLHLLFLFLQKNLCFATLNVCFPPAFTPLTIHKITAKKINMSLATQKQKNQNLSEQATDHTVFQNLHSNPKWSARSSQLCHTAPLAGPCRLEVGKYPRFGQCLSVPSCSPWSTLSPFPVHSWNLSYHRASWHVWSSLAFEHQRVPPGF